MNAVYGFHNRTLVIPHIPNKKDFPIGPNDPLTFLPEQGWIELVKRLSRRDKIHRMGEQSGLSCESVEDGAVGIQL